jgi:hypothetical protein
LQDPAVQDESGHEHVSANNSVVDVDEFHSGDEPEMEAQDDSAPVKDQDNGLAENNNAALHSIAIRDIEEAIS